MATKPLKTGSDFSSVVRPNQPDHHSVTPSTGGKVSDDGLAYDLVGRLPEPALTHAQQKFLRNLDEKRTAGKIEFSDGARAELECILKGVLAAFHVSTSAEQKLFRIVGAPFNIKLP
jgi:hypothetical protein